MKKAILLFCSLAMLLGLAGYRQDPVHGSQATEQISLTITPGESYTDFENIGIRIVAPDGQENIDKAALTVEWKNGSQYDAIYGSGYLIEHLEGENWVSCAMRDDLIWTAIAYTLDAGMVRSETYTLTDAFDISTPGQYRFKSECYVHESTEQSTKCELVAEFTVGS